MTDLDELQAIMQSLGFTKYEITVMLHLYEVDTSKADELKSEKVPLSRVYDALEMLTRKGFVSASQGRPRVFTPIHPKVAINNLLEIERRKQLDELDRYENQASQFLTYAQKLFDDTHTEIVPDDLLNQYSSLFEAEEKTKKIINSAQEQVLIFTHVFNWYTVIEDELKDALDRGCDVRILLQGKTNQQLLDTLSNSRAKVKVLPDVKLLLRGTIIDNSSVLFVIWDQKKSGNKKIYRPQYSSNKGIIDIFKMSFEYLWNS